MSMVHGKEWRPSGAGYSMKRILHLCILTAVVLGMLSAGGPVSAAPLQDKAILSLADFGAGSDIVLHGPYDLSHLRFSLPANWAVQDGGSLNLMISAYYSGEIPTQNQGQPDSFLGALLDVSINGHLLQSVGLRAGDNIVYQVPMAPADLSSNRQDGTLDLTFFLDASVDCNYDYHHTTVMIARASQAVLPYSEIPLQMDLHRLPWPIYQEGLLASQSATVVVPAQASASELRAGLLTMASFGRMSASKLPLALISADELTDDIRNQSNLIIVGKASALPILANAALPVPIKDSRYNSADMQADDGVVQITASPWNSAKTLLLIGGNTDAGVVKAAQALSTGSLQTAGAPTYSIVAQVNPSNINVAGSEEAAASGDDWTFASLGYATETLNGPGTNWFSYTFTIPTGQVAAADPTLKLVYSNSALVDPQRSGADVYLNGDLGGSVRFAEDASSMVTASIVLPRSSTHPGRNRLDIAVTLIPRDVCSIFTFNGLWITIYPDSVLHLPLVPASATAFALEDLSAFPYPFANDPSLGSTVFVVPETDHNAWTAAGSLAYDLGTQAGGAVLAFGAAYSGQLNDTVKKQDLILVGMPKDIGILLEMKDSLPAYFDRGSNAAILPSQQVTYRISPTKDLGYLELLKSPFADGRAIIGVLGTTGNGVTSAAKAILAAAVRENLKGNFVTVDGDQTAVVDTRSGLGIGQLPSALGTSVAADVNPMAVTTGVAPFTPEAYTRQPILGGLIAVIVLIVGVLAVVFATQRRKPKSRL